MSLIKIYFITAVVCLVAYILLTKIVLNRILTSAEATDAMFDLVDDRRKTGGNSFLIAFIPVLNVLILAYLIYVISSTTRLDNFIEDVLTDD